MGKRDDRVLKPKQPKVGKSVPSGKRAIVGTVPNDGNDRISWRFGDADRNGPYAWTEMVDPWHRDVLAFCREIDTMAWGAAQQGADARAKLIPLENLCPPAQARLRDLRRDDLDGLWELRLGGGERIWGNRIGHTFHVLWWDPLHLVCPSNPR